MLKRVLIAIVSLLIPTIVSAQTQLSGIGTFIDRVGGLVQDATYVVAAIALLAFFWGLAQFIFKTGSGDKTAIDNGKNLMKWGIIGLFVMVSIWGIIYFIGDQILGVYGPRYGEANSAPTIPVFRTY
jgi:hypothetical protein